jgi:tetratricopeptide (TPR) repeat protein
LLCAAALAAGREAVRLQRELDPAPHPAISTGLNAVALALGGLRRFDEARAAYDEALDEERRLTGEESARYAGILTSKSNVEMQTGRVDDAIALLERAAAAFARSAPTTYENALRCREKLAHAYQCAARWRDSLDVCRGLAPDVESASVPSSSRALMNHVRIASCAEALGDAEAAEVELASALERAAQARIPEDDGWETAAAAHLARLVAQRGDLARASSLVAHARGLRGDAELKTGASAWTELAAGVVAIGSGDLDRAIAALEPLARLERGPIFGEAAPALARAARDRALAVRSRSDAGARSRGSRARRARAGAGPRAPADPRRRRVARVAAVTPGGAADARCPGSPASAAARSALQR